MNTILLFGALAKKHHGRNTEVGDKYGVEHWRRIIMAKKPVGDEYGVEHWRRIIMAGTQQSVMTKGWSNGENSSWQEHNSR